MQEKEYPAFYQAANAASLDAQKQTLRLVRLYSLSLILTAFLVSLAPYWAASRVLIAVSLTGSLLVSIFMLNDKSQEVWYRARALAESIKTSSWRFMMRTDPYGASLSNADSEARFVELMTRLLSEHADISSELGGRAIENRQVTGQMRLVRSMKFEQRLELYLKDRVDEQGAWYGGKARLNRRATKKWFGLVWFIHALAILMVVLQFSDSGWSYWPVDVLVVAAGASLTWMQVKRFRDLAAAYGLTEMEIGLVRASADHVKNEPDFNRFVDDSENAFSREHTQWLARRNVF